jgi:hypothetical protein
MDAIADLAPTTTFAGYPFEVKERIGGLLSLRISLLGGPAAELALRLAGLDHVRVTRGPEALGRGRCYIAQCPGFKVVLSSDEGGESVTALVSRAPTEPAPQPSSSELGTLLAGLMAPAASAAVVPPARPGFTFHNAARAPLARTPLRAGKPLARKTPLTRKTPLRRGR